jgi:hypothetical protein
MAYEPLNEAESIVRAVQAEIDSGLPVIGGCTRGNLGAIGRAAQKLNMPASTLRDRVRPGGVFERKYGLKIKWSDPAQIEQESNLAKEDRRASVRGENGYDPVMLGFEVAEVSSKTTDGHWVKQKRERGDEFKPLDGLAVKGRSTYVGGDNRIIGQWILEREDKDKYLNWLSAIKESFQADIAPADPIPAPSKSAADLLTVYPIADLHVGMYAWAKETGEDFDLEILERLFIEKISTVIDRSPPSETAVILNIGDFFHSDSRSNRTEQSGHVLDVDSRWPRVLGIGVRLLRKSIELALRKHQKVIVRNLPGNHDYHSSFMLAIAMDCFFHNDPRVIVDMDPSKFWFYQFGSNLLSATHGDMARVNQMPGIIAAMVPKMWGDTLYRFCFTGHLHHVMKTQDELNGVQVEVLRTLSPRDFWNASMGYCSGRSLVSITYHRDNGEDSRVIESVPPIFRR